MLSNSEAEKMLSNSAAEKIVKQQLEKELNRKINNLSAKVIKIINESKIQYFKSLDRKFLSINISEVTNSEYIDIIFILSNDGWIYMGDIMFEDGNRMQFRLKEITN